MYIFIWTFERKCLSDLALYIGKPAKILVPPGIIQGIVYDDVPVCAAFLTHGQIQMLTLINSKTGQT